MGALCVRVVVHSELLAFCLAGLQEISVCAALNGPVMPQVIQALRVQCGVELVACTQVKQNNQQGYGDVMSCIRRDCQSPEESWRLSTDGRCWVTGFRLFDHERGEPGTRKRPKYDIFHEVPSDAPTHSNTPSV